jgi:hypothetical protein
VARAIHQRVQDVAQRRRPIERANGTVEVSVERLSAFHQDGDLLIEGVAKRLGIGLQKKRLAIHGVAAEADGRHANRRRAAADQQHLARSRRAFAAFFANLVIMSWSLGLVSTGVVLRWGLGAESFAWLIVFVFLPICCVYYPVTTLPGWLQPVALALPPTYVFEGLRAIVLEGAFVGHLMVKALALNVVYFIAGFAAFAYFLRSARIHGSLVQMGE